MKASTKPGRQSPNDQGNLDNLASLGIQVDPETGAVSAVGGAFEGSAVLGREVPDSFGTPGPTTTTQTVMPGTDQLEFGDDEGDEPPPTPEAPPAKAPGSQTEEGLAKREADARKAQQDLSKAQIKLDKTLAEVNRKFGDLEEQIQRFQTLQVTSGFVPPELNPAEPELVQQWRDDETTAEGVRVMEALVAPVYSQISQMREQVQAVVKRMGEFFSEMKENEVFTGVYGKIPKEKVQQITESPEFLSWLAGKPRSKRELYVDIINNTSNYSADEALEVFEEFANATGFDLGVAGSAPAPRSQTPPMDTSPRMRSGSALPEVVPTPQRRPTDALTPLSMAELATFGQDIQNVSPAEAAVLNKRLNLTQIAIDGNSHAQTAFNGRL